MVAAWQADHGYQVGLLRQGSSAFAVQAALDVPTRAHGIWVERSGTLLSVARRPGDWLLRWRADGTAVQWGWIEPDRAFNGHVVASLDGKQLYTTETDLETGAGLIGVRDAATLEKTTEWSTHGMDPHELLLDSDGNMVVANGGIPTLPETGRLKIHLDRMDASLVRLDLATGAMRGQWRLADKRLSLRHIAWGAPQSAGQPRKLCIALQAEHTDAAQRTAAPLLALFDGKQLQTFAAEHPLAGYGGDVAWADGLVAVSCPRANGVALWHGDGRWAGFTPLDEACPLASVTTAQNAKKVQKKSGPTYISAGGRDLALALTGAGTTQQTSVASLRLDNHWVALG